MIELEKQLEQTLKSEVGRIVVLYGNVLDVYTERFITLRQLLQGVAKSLSLSKIITYFNPTEQRLGIDDGLSLYKSDDECVVSLNKLQAELISGKSLPVIDLSAVNTESHAYKETLSQLPAIFANNENIGNAKLVIISASGKPFENSNFAPFVTFLKVELPDFSEVKAAIKATIGDDISAQDVSMLTKSMNGKPMRIIYDKLYELRLEIKNTLLKNVLRERFGKVVSLPDFTDIDRLFKGQREIVPRYKNLLKGICLGRQATENMSGMFLFTGLPGTGKTYLASLTASVFGSKDYGYINLANYKSAYGIFGSERGYVGYGQTSVAAQQIKSHRVVVLDEIDKCEDLLGLTNALLSVSSTGTLTDNNGELIDMRDKILVFISNLGSNIIKNWHGSYEEMARAVVADMKCNFFAGRLAPLFDRFAGNVFVFEPLSVETLTDIAKNKLEEEVERLATYYPNIGFSLSRSAETELKRIIASRKITSGRQVAAIVRNELLADLNDVLSKYVDSPEEINCLTVCYESGKFTLM